MTKKIKIFFIAFFLVSVFLCPKLIFAREFVTDWYIQDFDSIIIVNKNSTLDIVETIVADCGSAIGKHGIYRILPTSIKITDGTAIKTPITLLSITDENGQIYKYQETKNYFDATVTWKIGDPNMTVTGVNVYKIHYTVENVIRFDNAQFDELYWNLNGNFWDLETDKFHAKIIFPNEVAENNSTVEYYTGTLGSKDKSLANFYWSSPNVLEFDSNRTLFVSEGITASIIFPKNIFIPYQFGFFEIYGKYLSLFLPIIAFFVCFFLWCKYGNDPEVDKTIIPEYGVPGNLSPIELGMLMKNGRFDNKLITAEIIYFATRGIINIKEILEKVPLFTTKDFELERKQNQEVEKELSNIQKKILSFVFDDKQKIQLSSLKNSFFMHIKDIKKEAENILREKNLIVPAGLHLGIAFKIVSIVGFGLTFVSFGQSAVLGANVGIASLIVFLFSFIMPKRTLAGADLNWKIKGFKLFMKTVDKDRAAFYEKENIFEKFLPYAIVFGITKEWTKRIEDIYGKEFYNNYAPAWYAGSLNSFNADNFASAMDSLSSNISANTSAPSGSRGGGSAGSGGGGGGGGGW